MGSMVVYVHLTLFSYFLCFFLVFSSVDRITVVMVDDVLTAYYHGFHREYSGFTAGRNLEYSLNIKDTCTDFSTFVPCLGGRVSLIMGREITPEFILA